MTQLDRTLRMRDFSMSIVFWENGRKDGRERKFKDMVILGEISIYIQSNSGCSWSGIEGIIQLLPVAGNGQKKDIVQ